MSKNGRGGGSNRRAPTTLEAFQDNVTNDLTLIREENEKCDNQLTGKIEKVKSWNQKQDENITLLVDRVDTLEANGKEKESRSVDDIVKEKVDAVVSDQLERMVAEKIAIFVQGGELEGRVGVIVKGLLGTKGKNGKVMSVTQLAARGNLKCVNDLKKDEKGFYNGRVSKYGFCVWCC
jgi:hypothetical protein